MEKIEWEYKVITWREGSLEDFLNKYGADHWELVDISGAEVYQCVFKRPVLCH